MYNRLFLYIIILLLNLSSFVLCKDTFRHKIIYIGYTQAKPFWSDLGNKVQNSSAKYNLDIIDLTTTQLPKENEQTELMEFALKQKAHALILGIGSPINFNKLNEALTKFQKANIPVILIDTNHTHPAVKAFITSDNLFGGKLAREYACKQIKKLTHKKSKALILGGEEKHPNSSSRIKGFTETCNQGGMDYIITHTNWSTEEAYNLCKKYLSKENDITTVYSCWDPGIIVAEAYWNNLKSTKDIIFIGFDGLPQTIELIKRGRIDATVAQDSDKMAEETVKTTHLILNNAPYQKETLILPILITKESLSYKVKNSKKP